LVFFYQKKGGGGAEEICLVGLCHKYILDILSGV